MFKQLDSFIVQNNSVDNKVSVLEKTPGLGI